MPVSPILERQTTYPFVRLNEAARRIEERGIEVIDFGTGDPQEPTDPLIREALVAGLRERMGYPAAAGLPELREAIAAWAARRFDVVLDPDTEVIPTLGSKEAIFSFAQVVVDIERGKDTVAYTEPGYPVYERGALFAHAPATVNRNIITSFIAFISSLGNGGAYPRSRSTAPCPTSPGR